MLPHVPRLRGEVVRDAWPDPRLLVTLAQLLLPVLNLLGADLVALPPRVLEEPHDLLVVGAPNKALIPELLVQKGKTRGEGQLVLVYELIHGGGREDHVSVTISSPHLYYCVRMV